IVTIEDDEVIDVEACGGTHLSSTSEAEEFVVTGSRKIQDGVIRLEYKAGEAALNYVNQVRKRVKTLADKLGVEEPDNHREAQRKLCKIFSVEPGHLEKTIQKFRDDNDMLSHKIRKLEHYLDEDVEIPSLEGETLEKRGRSLFETRKEREKVLEGLENDIEAYVRSRMDNRVIEEKVPTENIGLLIQVAQKLSRNFEASVTLVGEKGAVSASYHEDYSADENLEKYSDNVQGDEDFAKAFDI
ncbi:MAG: hypothetical protein ABEJ72_01720, partial [Candidatus Aenigmatarchaeota archaeon]